MKNVKSFDQFVNEGKYRIYMNSDADEPNEIDYEEYFGDGNKAAMIKKAKELAKDGTNQYGDPIKITVTAEDDINDVVWTNESVNEELLNAGNLPTPTDELTDMLRMKNQSFRNRIIVHLEGGTLDGWYEYNEDYFGDGEWEEISYGDYKKTTNIVFDQDVLPGSEKLKEAKAWKKWLIGMSKKKGFAYKVKEVYLGEI